MIICFRYFTSKCHEIQDLENLCYFGYRGEALASLKDMAAILDITTRTRQSSRTYCKMFQRGSSLSVFESAVHRPSAGTTITVHDLFYNLPVRKKAVNESLELERIRHRMEGIALIHTNISFSLRNDVTGHIILQTHKSSCIMTAFTYLFGPGKAKCLSPVSSNHGEFQVEGYMGKEPHYNKELQFIYINGRMVLKTKIHKLINKILSKSLVFKRKPFTSEGQVPVNVNSSPTKQNEKYSIFVLNVKCPLDVYDITFDPAKTLVEFKDWAVLTSSIESMVWRYLKKENLISLADSSCLILNPDKTAVDSEKQCTDTQVFVSDGDAHESETGSKRNSDDSNKTGDTDSVDSILIEKESKSQTQCIENIGDRISTHTMMQSLHSQLVTRTSCVKDDQNNTKETEENQHDKSSESDIAGVDNDPHGHVSSEPLVSTHKSDGSSISIPSALSSVAATVSVSSDDGGKATVSCISISDVESKHSDSDITAAESCGGSVVDSCLKTPVRPTVHVCVNPMIAAAPSTTTCSQTKRRFKSADNYQISTCDSDVETEDPLISPLKIQCTKHRIQKQNVNISNSMYGRNQKTELCRSDEGSISPCPEDPHGLEQPAVTNRVKPKIHETLSRLFSRNARVNKISHITLTPEKRRASGSFRQKISEKLAADGFIDPAFKKVCNLEYPSSNTGQIKHSIPKNTVLMSELEKRIHIGQGGGGKASSSLGLNVAEENQYQSSYLLQAESPLHFSVPSCSTVKQVDKTQNAQQHHGRCQHTVTTQTSPDLQKRNTGKMDTEYGVRKRFHPPCRYSSVASKLSKLVQANAQNETKGNGSCEKESSGMRFRFMTSTSFFETPRTVFKRLSAQTDSAVFRSETTVDAENRRGVENVNERLNAENHQQTGESSHHVGVCGIGTKELTHELNHFQPEKQDKDPSGVKVCCGKLKEPMSTTQLLKEEQNDKRSGLNKTKTIIDPQALANWKNNQDHIQRSHLMDINDSTRQPIDACCVQNKVKNLTVVHVDDGNKSQSSINLTFAQQNIQQPIQLDDTVINMQLIKSFCHIQNSSREPVSTIDQEAGLRTNPMLPEASQGFNMPNECETHAETNTEQDPLFRSQGFNIPSKFGISEDPSQRSECYSLAFDVSCRPVINSHPSKSSEFHSHGFSLSPLEFETAEPVKETTSSCRYYETQQLTPPVTMEKTGELVLQKKTSLFCDIFTPLESGADNLLKSAMLDSKGKTCSSQGPGVNDGLSSEIPCGQRPECSKSDADLCETTDTSPLNSLLSKQSESTETLQADLGEKHAVEHIEKSPNTSGIPVCKDGSIVTLVGKSSVTTVKPHSHMDSSLMHINTSGVISVSYNTTVKPHGDKNTVLSAENSSMPVDTNSETTAKAQSHVISSVISADTCRPVLITSSDTASKPGSSEICVNTSRQVLSTNNDTLEPHVSVNVLMCKENSNVTLNQVNDFTEESSTQMKSLNCTDDFTVAVVNMSAEVTSRPHTQMNSLNVAVHLTDTCEELQSQTNECIEMESYEDSGVIPLVSSSDIESNIQISNQSVSTNLNRSETNINDKTDPEEMLGDQKCHINLSGGSLMTSAENAQSLKPSICEVWSPDSILDNFEMLGAGSDGCNQVKHPPPPSLLPPSSLPTPSSPLPPSSTPSSSSYVPNAPQDSAGIDGKEQTQEVWKQVEDPKTG